MTGLMSFSRVDGASPATSRAHWYSSSMSAKKPSSSPSRTSASRRRCNVTTSASPASAGITPAAWDDGSGGGGTRDRSRVLGSATDYEITRVTPEIQELLAESKAGLGEDGDWLLPADMRQR